MIIGGIQKKTEVVELINSRSTHSYGDLPTKRAGAVGVMFPDIPILCGGGYYESSNGYVTFDSCITFQNSQWIQSHSMNEK